MTRFELKKIFLRKSNQTALLVLLGVLLVISYLVVHEIDYIDENGEAQYGISAIEKLKAEKKKWAGPLTEERLKEVLSENERINATPEGQSEKLPQADIAYGWKQGIQDILQLMRFDYSGFNNYEYSVVDSLKPEQMKDFYPNRIENLKEWLSGDGKDELSESEKDFLVKNYEEIPTPLVYDYSEGWTQFFQYSPSMIMIMTMILGFLCAGIFSCEKRYRADAVFFSSYYGRNRAIWAKIKAGLLSVTVIYWIVMLLYSGIVLGFLGMDGWNLRIQSAMSGWKSCYNITNFQEYLLIMGGGYVGCLVIMLLTMLISAMSKSAMVAVVTPFVLIFLPSFLSDINAPVVKKILGLLPDQLLQMNMVVKYFNLYEIGGKIYQAGVLLPILYLIIGMVLVPLIYRIYRRA